MRRRILICEDDEDVLEVTKEILEKEGCDVFTLMNSINVSKEVANFNPHLILLDISMPKIDGKEVVRILKSDMVTKNIPIIIISALSNTNEIAKEVGANGFLDKPFEINDLINIVKHHSLSN
jgi:CheY-like chemotaxis protein